MLKNKGLTLVELLAAIVILGIILTIAIPRIGNIIENSKQASYDIQIKGIEDTVAKYLVLYRHDIDWVDNTADIYLYDLQVANLIAEPIRNPKTGDLFDHRKPQGFKITVTKEGSLYTYTPYDPSIPIELPDPVEFTYTNPEPYEWIIPETGRYKIEVWGAQGGHGSGESGLGGYTYGEINLFQGEILKIFVGEKGDSIWSGSLPNTFGGGGGSSAIGFGTSSGGGATDVRRFGDSLFHRIIVAGGGGGGYLWEEPCYDAEGHGGHGGELNGGDSQYEQFDFCGNDDGIYVNEGTGGTQNSPGYALDGQGNSTNFAGFGAGIHRGGGGWYGGSHGGGGSSYYGRMIEDGTRGAERGVREGHGRAAITYIGSTSGPSTPPFDPIEVELAFTGGVQTWSASETGVYVLELWGAQGGRIGTDNNTGGRGGYVLGIKELSAGTTLHIYVGGKGGDSETYIDGWVGHNNNGGWNGGGQGAGSRGPGGGGATDIRLGGVNLTNRIIVAGGGGGGFVTAFGFPSAYSFGGNTVNLYQLGQGQSGFVEVFTDPCTYDDYPSDNAGGGGGYYGGQTVRGDNPSRAYGGSNYVGGVQFPSQSNGVNLGNGKVRIFRIN